jgi:hypothetical protein
MSGPIEYRTYCVKEEVIFLVDSGSKQTWYLTSTWLSYLLIMSSFFHRFRRLGKLKIFAMTYLSVLTVLVLKSV